MKVRFWFVGDIDRRSIGWFKMNCLLSERCAARLPDDPALLSLVFYG